MRTLVVAEPGSTGIGSLDTMLRLLETAAECGADVWKPQWTSSPERMCDRRRAPEYLDSYRLLAYPVEWLKIFSRQCKRREMKLACSVYLPEDVQAVSPYCQFIKIASFENRDGAMLDALGDVVSRKLHHVIISTGMLDASEIKPLVSYADILLACTSAYPAPVDAMNLLTIRQMRRDCGGHCRIGLSDHSRQLITGAVAVGVGAEVVETHYRLNDTPPTNRDYEVALSPGEFTQYVQNVRLAERLMGNAMKRQHPCEESLMRYRVRS